MGADDSLARSGLRASFGWNSREEDIDAAIAALRVLIARRSALRAA